MALTNAQYDEIMRSYQQRQLHNRHLTEERIAHAYNIQPRLKELSDSIAACYAGIARNKIEGNSDAVALLQEKQAGYRTERSALLAEMGLSEDDFSPVYTCPDCKDTGYVGSEKCHCFKQVIIDTVYSQSNIRNILERENFNTFSYKYYSSEDRNPATGLSALETMQRAVAECRRFIDDFDNKPKNLFFYGDTGVGKTFLSNCVAKELLEKGRSVIYFTSFQIFDILSKGIFDKDADAIAAHQNIFDCDLLIIDDLGTELANSFTTSQLFLCINERILRQKSTIISTNLNMNQMVDIYSERTLSRISSNYSIIKLFGDDIRIQKRQFSQHNKMEE